VAGTPQQPIANYCGPFNGPLTTWFILVISNNHFWQRDLFWLYQITTFDKLVISNQNNFSTRALIVNFTNISGRRRENWKHCSTSTVRFVFNTVNHFCFTNCRYTAASKTTTHLFILEFIKKHSTATCKWNTWISELPVTTPPSANPPGKCRPTQGRI
jgi:hypothetical protein